jgi:hypothetical protein
MGLTGDFDFGDYEVRYGNDPTDIFIQANRMRPSDITSPTVVDSVYDEIFKRKGEDIRMGLTGDFDFGDYEVKYDELGNPYYK